MLPSVTSSNQPFSKILAASYFCLILIIKGRLVLKALSRLIYSLRLKIDVSNLFKFGCIFDYVVFRQVYLAAGWLYIYWEE
jgi:hypothetical protein